MPPKDAKLVRSGGRLLDTIGGMIRQHIKLLFTLMLPLLIVACGEVADDANDTETEAPENTTEEATAEAVEIAEDVVVFPNDDATVLRGEIAYGIFCVACHGPGATGIENLGLNLTDSAYIGNVNDEELLAFVIEGRTASHPDNISGVAMPPRGGYPNLSDDQIKQIIAYLRSIYQG